MPGQDLRQTLVTIGLSIVIADLPDVGDRRAGAPDVAARRGSIGPLRGIPVIKAYSTYRLALLPIGIAIGVALWLFLNRTRVGMMIRAGVDDRAMLAAAGVNVNLVFADHLRHRRRASPASAASSARSSCRWRPARTRACCSPRSSW